ncbi:MAG TPA: LysR family transcriptional regulator [Bacillales bacterium]|nr:LysR family transcriptional regulator [Bacillales bacterium]
MDFRHLRYFVTIAREGQITRAAKKLHMAQPPLSQQLKQLEEELGVLLIERNGRKMELTKAGEVLLEKAETLLHQMEETVKEVKETGHGLRGTLSIGCVKSCFAPMPERIRAFRKKYPLVTFHLRSGDSFRMAENLRNREIELAIVRLPLEMSDFHALPLPQEPYVAVVPEAWTQGREENIPLEKLAAMPLVLLHRISGVGQFETVVNHFKDHGLEPNVVCECPDAAMLLELVTAGVGAAVLPESTLLPPYGAGRRVLRIEGPPLLSESAVIWMKDRYLSKNAEHFLERFEG